MESSLLIGLTAIVGLGVAAQWLAARLHVPSILLLLLTGFACGPLTGAVSPDALFGELLVPLVSLSVGVIMFEGGMSLRFTDLRQTGATIRNLIVLGALITWLASAAAAALLLDLDVRIALLLGAVLIVTGPTVIIPMLRQIRPHGQVGSILKWEGILIDPLGATLALLVFESISAAETSEATAIVVIAIVKTLVAGILIGMAAAIFLTQTLRRYWIPDYLQIPVTLALVLIAFTSSNAVQHESGLLAVTVMGIYLANQKRVEVRHILEFKENLRVMLIGGLFIVLAARVDPASIRALPLESVAFVAFLIIVVRPAVVALATMRSPLTWRERLFLSAMAPRGIVAASVSSVFALQLQERGFEGADALVSLTFLVIMSTVLIYGLTAGPLARKLHLADPNPQGILMVGASEWARALAGELRRHEIPVVVADTNYDNIRAARMQGLRTYFGNVLSEHANFALDLGGIGRIAALTPNDEINSFAAMHFSDTFGRGEVYQLPPMKAEEHSRDTLAQHLRGRELFAPPAGFRELSRLFREGAQMRSTTLTKQFTFDDYKAYYGDSVVPLALVGAEHRVRLFTVKDPPKPLPGHIVIALVKAGFVAQEEKTPEAPPADSSPNPDENLPG